MPQQEFSNAELATIYDSEPAADWTQTNQFAGTGHNQQQPEAEAQGEGEATSITKGDPVANPESTSGEPAKPEGAPESYDFKSPEGVEYDPQVLGSFSEAARVANLTQDAAQKLLDTMAPKLAERTQAQVAAIHQQWIDTSRADKEFGGDKLTENLGVAKRALDRFSNPEDREFLETTGLGNHPAIIRILFRAGRAISEDGYVAGSSGGRSNINPLSVLYDKTSGDQQ